MYLIIGLFFICRFIYISYILHNINSRIFNKLEQEISGCTIIEVRLQLINDYYTYQDKLSFSILEFGFLLLELTKWSRKELVKDKQIYKEYFGDN